MATIVASVGRGGVNRPDDVRVVQTLLNRHVLTLGLPPLVVDGFVGPRTISAIDAFQRRVVGLGNPDGRVDPNGRTLAALDGSPGAVPPGPVPGAQTGPAWPPPPAFPPLASNEARARVFGRYEYVADPVPGNPENIRILGNWVRDNIVSRQIDMGPNLGTRTFQFHRLAAQQLTDLWAAWQQAGLLDRVIGFSGSFVPRFVRGSTTVLSNHAFGSAFDINAQQNPRGSMPALLGTRGCVRELVPIANSHGFYWGGHLSVQDGMHFEIAQLR